jgi:hypothetical protein
MLLLQGRVGLAVLLSGGLMVLLEVEQGGRLI